MPDGAIVGTSAREADAMTAVGTAEIGKLRFRKTAVGQHDEITRAVEQVCRPPVGLDDTTSVPSLSTIQSPTSYGLLRLSAMPENTSASVLCKARPRMIAKTPDVAINVPTGAPKT